MTPDQPVQKTTNDMMSIREAQQDMRDAYYGGATGAVTSATAWLAAAVVATFSTATAAAYALYALGAPVISGAYTGALIEYAYGTAIFLANRPGAD